jgi:hypothetical protein
MNKANKAGGARAMPIQSQGKAAPPVAVPIRGENSASRANVAGSAGRAMAKMAGGLKRFAKGGSASARADGCATKGKTKGKMLAMGGKAKGKS